MVEGVVSFAQEGVTQYVAVPWLRHREKNSGDDWMVDFYEDAVDI